VVVVVVVVVVWEWEFYGCLTTIGSTFDKLTYGSIYFPWWTY